MVRRLCAEVLPNFDRDRVYPSDIRKLLNWYNILIKAGINEFTPAEEQAAEAEGTEPEAEEAK